MSQCQLQGDEKIENKIIQNDFNNVNKQLFNSRNLKHKDVERIDQKKKDNDGDIINQGNKLTQKQKIIVYNRWYKALLDFVSIIFFILSIVYVIRITDRYNYLQKQYEKQILSQSQQYSQQVENIMEILSKSKTNLEQANNSNLYFVFSKQIKFYLKSYDNQEFSICQRVIRYKDCINKDIKINKILFYIQSKLKIINSYFKLFQSKKINQVIESIEISDEENQKLVDQSKYQMSKSIPKTYHGIIQQIQKIFNQLLSKNSQLKFYKIKYFGTSKYCNNEDVNIAIYICSEKIQNKQQISNLNQNIIQNQTEQIITQFIQAGLKLQKLKLDEDFIIQNNKLILNPSIILRHDPEIATTYYQHIYKQLCKQLQLQVNETFLTKISNSISKLL
ncbi:hypothetical protein ABPG74_010039 [Tetrahymena malaccensis]